MKQILLALILLFPFSEVPNEEINKEITVNGRTILYGQINREGLTSNSYAGWFNLVYNRYELNTEIVSQVKQAQLKGLTVKLFMGTWCGDSQRNVPVFYKFIDQLKISENQIDAWALDLNKKGPNAEQATYNISRVPTIIFYRNGKEIGRFIERPQPGEKLEQLWVDIINGN